MTSPLPCTPRGIIDLMQRHGVDLHGADVVVVGRGVTVGRSIGLLLTRREILSQSTVLLLLVPLAGAVAACGSSGGGSTATASSCDGVFSRSQRRKQ